VEAGGSEAFVDQLREELVQRTYRPQRARKVEIPKGGGKMRQLSIPSIRDRVVQGALKLILEPIFEADFQPGSFGYRPKKSAHAAIQRVQDAILQGKSYVIDFDLRSYFDTVKHHIVLAKVARRVDDEAILWLLKLERAKEVTRTERWAAVEYARFADDLVILVDSQPRQQWLRQAVEKRLRDGVAGDDGCRCYCRKARNGRPCWASSKRYLPPLAAGSLITFDVKCAGARSAGNPHATCDVAGAGNGFTVRLVRHSQRKRGANKIGLTFGIPRQSSTLPGASERADACNCGGAGMPCPVCNQTSGEQPPKLPDGYRTMFDKDGWR
jgi:hypothetical protein